MQSIRRLVGDGSRPRDQCQDPEPPRLRRSFAIQERKGAMSEWLVSWIADGKADIAKVTPKLTSGRTRHELLTSHKMRFRSSAIGHDTLMDADQKWDRTRSFTRKLQMSAETYPEDMIEYLVRDPSDLEYGELLAPGEPLPGGWSIEGVRTLLDDEELLARALAAARAKVKLPPTTWQGSMRWRTQHGPAIVAWSLGKPREAWNVRLADDRRVKALKIHDGSPKLWRRTADQPPRKYQTGEVEITDIDVVFIDVDDRRRYEPPAFGDKPNLERDLATDPVFVSALADTNFALAVVAEMNQINYVRLDGGKSDDRHMDRDRAAHLVAGLRGIGEELGDFQYWDQTIPMAELRALRDKVRERLHHIGWRPDFEQ